MAKRQKSQAQKTQQYGYRIKMDSLCDSSERSEEVYGHWEESWTNTLGSVAEKEPTYPDVVSTHNVELGENALVVWVEWDSGDSFGRGYRKYAEIIGMFRDMKSARSLADQIKAWRPNEKKNSNAYEFRTPDGQVFQSGFAPWAGYFESLAGVHIDAVTVF